MLRFDCKFCFENVFDVVDIEHLGVLPHSWVCSGCGRKYTGELNDSGILIVYLKGYKRHATVYGDVPAGPEKLAEELAEPAVAEEPAPGSEAAPESEPGTGEPAEEVE